MLGVLSGEPYVLIEVEAYDLRGVHLPSVDCPGKVLVEAGGGISGGQPHHTAASRLKGIVNVAHHYLGCHLAHMFKVSGHHHR